MNQTSLPYRRSFVAIAILQSRPFLRPPSGNFGGRKAAPAAAKSQEAGRLIIVRSANLGGAVVGVSIDAQGGRQTDLQWPL